ncbi:MAG: trimeric intracellular cation channel family protein [Pseudomonadota bacterium]|nr:trimeric intracellular cation channel family protein [Pseudomonadota bacterium]
MSSVIGLLDYFGVIVFAVSGALVAARARMDMVGFALLGIVTGIGGGTLRDVLLGRLPVFWIERPIYVVLCIGGATATFFAVPFVTSRLRALLWADAVGLAVFAVTGTEIARAAGAPPLIAALMGVMTATFGGIIRDVLCREVPLILLKEIYATAALAGALVYILCVQAGVAQPGAVLAGCLVTFAARGVALVYGLSLPAFTHPHDRPGGGGPAPRQ